MLKEHAQYEPFAWWLIRERVGQDLRERYDPVSKELPPRLLALVKKLGAIENDRLAQETSPSLLRKLDAVEGNQLLRACRKRLGPNGDSGNEA
jgi:hypothetical protein